MPDLDDLIGHRLLFMCGLYFYEGILDGVSDHVVTLLDAHIVYDTGEWSASDYSDRQKLNSERWHVLTRCIESYGYSKIKSNT